MDRHVDIEYIRDTFAACVQVDSPVGYYPEIHSWLAEAVGEWGYELTFDHKQTAYVKLEGQDPTHTICVGAHLDTIGLVVRGINADGTLRIRQLGGINYHSIEGVTCYVHTRTGDTVVGQVILDHHSVHVFDDCKTRDRDENTMCIKLVADVYNERDVRALGITEGAIVGIDPQYEAFDNGYIVSRHIDDKAAVAVLLEQLKYFAETQTKPYYTTYMAFPLYEEIGHGGSWVPEEVEEYVALDITLIGPDYQANEHHVAVIAADARGPYDWELTNTLMRCAEVACDEDKRSMQVCFHYSTDAAAAYTHTNNLRAGAFGMACINTHGRERSHIDSFEQTARLCRAYLRGEGRAER